MITWVGGLARDLRHGARGLTRSPALVVTCALSLGLGIGLNAVLYMGISTIYWHEPTTSAPGQVVAVEPVNANQFSYLDYQDLARSGIFEAAAGFRTSAMNLGTGTDISRTSVMVVTANFFDTLGIEPAQGRTFGAGEAASAREPRVAVVTWGFWRARVHADPSAIGRTIVLDGERFEVAGVLADDYRAVTGWMAPAIYVPVSRLTLPSLDSRGSPSLTVLATLPVGTSAAQAREAVTAFGGALERTYPDRLTAKGRRASVFPLAELQFRGTPAQFSLLVTVTWVTAALVLLIACVNVTGLLMARATDRRRELAIRVALGAGRAGVVRTLLAESFLLVIAGALVGLPLAHALTTIPFPGAMGALQDAMRPDARLLPFALSLVALATLACGLVPALRASRADVIAEVRQGGETATPRTRLRQGLVAAQVAMSFVLIVAALLCVRSQARVTLLGPGFDADSVVVARISLDPRVPDEARTRLAERLVERIEALPGVTSAVAADVVPLGGDALVRSFHPAGRTDIPGTRPHTYSVGPSYFRTLGIPLVRGRDFDASDRADAPAVAIVNETFARTYFPGGEALGQRVQTEDDPEAEVVGVVRDHRIGTIGEAPASVVFYPYAQQPSALNVHVRTPVSPESQLSAVRQALDEIAGAVPVSVQTLRAATSLEFTMRATGTALMGVMGGVGLLLAVVGIYGVLAYVAATRTMEVGIRMALGASGADVQREMLKRALRTVVPGVALGILAALVILPALATFLAGIHPYDPLAVGGAVLVLLVVGLAAGYVPARRLGRLNPMQALRRT
jgi:predicted permease